MQQHAGRMAPAAAAAATAPLRYDTTMLLPLLGRRCPIRAIHQRSLHILAVADRREHRAVTLALEQLQRRVPAQATVQFISTTDGQQTAGVPLPWEIVGWDTVHPETEVVLAAHWGKGIEGLEDAEVHREIMARCPSLRWLHTMSTGVEHLPLAALAERGVTTTHHTGVSDAPLVEFALAGLLHFSKQLPRVHAAQAARRWERFAHRTLAGSTLAIVGFGSIGRAIGRAAANGLGMNVVAVSRRELSPSELAAGGATTCACIGDADGQGGARSDRLRWALDSVDHVGTQAIPTSSRLYTSLRVPDGLRLQVVLALPHTVGTAGMVGATELAALKDGCVLVNVGRGSTVDEAALAAALTTRGPGSLSFAGDVFTTEPLPQVSALWELPNALISAHCMDWTDDAVDKAASAWVRNVEGFARSGEVGLEGVVKPHLGY